MYLMSQIIAGINQIYQIELNLTFGIITTIESSLVFISDYFETTSDKDCPTNNGIVSTRQNWTISAF